MGSRILSQRALLQGFALLGVSACSLITGSGKLDFNRQGDGDDVSGDGDGDNMGGGDGDIVGDGDGDNIGDGDGDGDGDDVSGDGDGDNMGGSDGSGGTPGDGDGDGDGDGSGGMIGDGDGDGDGVGGTASGGAGTGGTAFQSVLYDFVDTLEGWEMDEGSASMWGDDPALYSYQSDLVAELVCSDYPCTATLFVRLPEPAPTENLVLDASFIIDDQNPADLACNWGVRTDGGSIEWGAPFTCDDADAMLESWPTLMESLPGVTFHTLYWRISFATASDTGIFLDYLSLEQP